jgi:hypothetical protein
MAKFAAFILLLAIAAAHAETRWQKWTRRIVLSAACAASAVDGYDSATKIDGSRFYETNPMLRNSNGTLNVGRTVTLKIGMCAAPFIMSEFSRNDSLKRDAFIGGSGTLGVFTWIDVHNRAVFKTH